MTSGSGTRIELIPWDPDSPSHRKLLVRHREECGWHQEKPDGDWRQQQFKGTKAIYWIVLSLDDSPDVKQTKAQLDTPEADLALEDTARSIHATPRQPTQKPFFPIGHISLDSDNPEAEPLALGLPSTGTFWIKTFYVSKALQSKGIGRAAMDEVEQMAVREPMNACTLAIDTVHEEDQAQADFVQIGAEAPKVTNHAWYSRRGYRHFKTVLNYYDVRDKTGKVYDTRTVFLRKDIT